MRKLQIKDIYFGKSTVIMNFLNMDKIPAKDFFMSFLILIFHAYLMAQHIIYSETKALVKPCFSNTLKV